MQYFDFVVLWIIFWKLGSKVGRILGFSVYVFEAYWAQIFKGRGSLVELSVFLDICTWYRFISLGLLLRTEHSYPFVFLDISVFLHLILSGFATVSSVGG